MPSGFTYFASSRTYTDAQGRAVSNEQLRSWVSATVDAAKENVTKLAETYKTDNNVAGFTTAMRDEIRDLNRAMALVVYGGELTNKEWGSVGAIVKDQRGYLDAWVVDLLNGTSEMDASRAAMYMDAAYASYSNMTVDREQAAGVSKVTWVTAGDGSECDGCAGAAGEYAIEDVPELGSNECLVKCRCVLLFSENEGNATE